MATAEQIKALVASFASEDGDRFRAVTMQIAALAAKQGKSKLAEELRALLNDAASRRNVHVGPARPTPIARPARDLAGLLTVDYPETRLTEMVLPEVLASELQRIVAEYQQRDRLRSSGLSPRRRLLLVGPPGCGKTMTARALARECHLPLLSIQLHSLITKFMGETAAKLHLIFEAMQQTPGVYLFDEFDALGSGRDAPNDVGEIRRVIGSLLQFLEHHDSDGFVIAATNLREQLDSALFRRFDAVLTYSMPEEDSVRPLIAQRLGMFDLTWVAWSSIAIEASGLSHADIVRSAEEAARDAVMAERHDIQSSDLIRALQRRKSR